MYQHIKERLLALVKDRNFTFLDTTRTAATAYLQKFIVFEGLSEEEVITIEESLNYRFPNDFRVYLKTFGKKGGLLFEAGADLNPKELVMYQEMGRRLVKGEGFPDFFKDDTIVFEQHQGYAFCCFHSNEKDEAEIYSFSEGYGKPVKRYNNFTEMLNREIEIIERRHEEIKSYGGYFVRLGNGEEHIMPNGSVKPRDAEDIFLD